MPIEEINVIFLATFVSVMLFFFLSAAYIEKKKPPLGHETGVTILLGIGVSFLLWNGFGISNVKHFQFSSEAFFNFFLPPIIFNSGFNMRKKSFF